MLTSRSWFLGGVTGCADCPKLKGFVDASLLTPPPLKENPTEAGAGTEAEDAGTPKEKSEPRVPSAGGVLGAAPKENGLAVIFASGSLPLVSKEKAGFCSGGAPAFPKGKVLYADFCPCSSVFPKENTEVADFCSTSLAPAFPKENVVPSFFSSVSLHLVVPNNKGVSVDSLFGIWPPPLDSRIPLSPAVSFSASTAPNSGFEASTAGRVDVVVCGTVNKAGPDEAV